MPNETSGEALVRLGNQFLLANLFQTAGILAAEILRKDPDLDPSNEDDLATAMRRATDAVANEYGRMGRTWCDPSTDQALAQVMTTLLSRRGQP